MPKTIDERLNGLTIQDPETGRRITVSTQVLLRYLNQPGQLEFVISRIRTAAQEKYKTAIDGGTDPATAAAELQADLAALDQLSEQLWRDEASILKDTKRFRGVRDAARLFEQRVYNQFRAATMRIGMVELNDDNIAQEPTVLQIDDQYDVQRLGTLRSDTDVVVKGNKTQTEIRVYLTFPDLHSINTTLRDLLAQCRAAPIITIESDMLIDVLINKFATPETMNFMIEQAAKDGTVDLDDPLDKLSTRAQNSLEALKDVIASGDEATLYAIARARHEFLKRTDAKTPPPVKEDIQDRPAYGVAIPVALREVEMKSNEEGSHTVDVVLHFRRINEHAYTSGRLQWRTPDGFPTFDITKCEPLRSYYRVTYLEDNGDDKQTFMEPIPGTDTEVNCPLVLRWRNYFTGQDRELDLTNAKAAIHSIAIGWRNKLAFLPLIGQHNPTVQHLGTSNSMVRMQILTTDRDVVRDLHAMKDELDQLRRHFSNINRDERVNIQNGLVNLVGGREFILSSISTQTDPRSSELVYITLTFVESKYSLRDREQVSLYQEHYSPRHVKALWNYMGRVAREALRKLSQRQLLESHEEQVLGILFGTGIMGFDETIRRRNGWRGDASTSTAFGTGKLPTNVITVGGSRGRGIAGVYKTPADNADGILNQYVLAAALVHHYTRGEDSSSTSWLHWKGRTSESIGEGVARVLSFSGAATPSEVRRQNAEITAIKLDRILAFPSTADPRSRSSRSPAVTNLGYTLRESVAGTNSPTSADTFRVFVGQDDLSEPPWFTEKFWESIFQVLEFRVGDQNPRRDHIKWTADDLAQGHSYLIGVLANGIADIWPGFDQSRFLKEGRKFSKLLGDGDVNSNYPDLYLPRYSEIFSADPLFDERTFPDFPEQDPSIIGTFIPVRPNDTLPAVVVRVIDGDTVELDDARRIRLIGVGAPEIDTLAGQDAQAALEEVLLGKSVEVEVGEVEFDQHGRTLAYLWLGDIMVNQFMVGSGNAEFFQFRNQETWELENDKYADAFQETENAKRRLFGTSRSRGFNRGRLLPIWRNFAPRWRDLGVRPPFRVRAAYGRLQDALDEIARDPSDFVEPGFFYWRTAWKDRLPTVAQINKEVKKRREEAKQYTITLDQSEFSAEGDVQDTLDNLVTELLRDGRLDDRHASARLASDRGQAKNLLNRINRRETDVPVINFIDRQGKIIAYAVHAPGSNENARTRHFKVIKFKGGPLRVRNPYDSSVLAHDEMLKPGGLSQVSGQMPDDHFSLARAYPTYRVYAIEEDRESLVYSDDFYGVNCVSSIEVQHSKANPSLAILRITNTTGSFENDAFLDLDNERLKELSPDDEGELFFKSFRFRTGTLIQVRMGYTSVAEDLPIVFSGRVVEVQFGPVITLVCQGHRAEMLQEVELATSTMDPFQILDVAFRKIGPAPSLGRSAKMGEISNKLAKEVLGEYAAKQINWWGRLWKHEINSHLKNVYIQSNSIPVKGWMDVFTEGFSDDYRAALGEKLRRFANWIPVIELLVPDESFDYWVCPQQPMWNMVQEITRHMPGTLCYVVPYEQDGTLFLGKPTTPYIYENPPLGEKRAYDKMFNVVKRAAVQDLSLLLLNRFLESKFFVTTLPTVERKTIFFIPVVSRIDHVVDPAVFEGTKKISTVADLDRWSRKSFAYSKLLTGLKTDGTFGDLNPAGITATLDFSNDWRYLYETSPGLARAVFGFWHGLPMTGGVWNGTLEGDWPEICELICSKLREGNDRSSVWTAAWERLESQYFDNPNSPLNVDIQDVNYEKGLHREGVLDKLMQQLSDTGIEIENQADMLAVARRELDELERGGRFPAATIRQLREQIDARFKTFSEFRLETPRLRRAQAGRVRQALKNVLGDSGFGAAGSGQGETSKLATVVRFEAQAFRLLVHHLALYVRENLAKNGIEGRAIRREAMRTALEDSRAHMLPPGWKQFRDYHVITSENDIIENEITASMENMHNAVLIRYPHGSVETTVGDFDEDNVSPNPDSQFEDERVAFKESQHWESYPKTGGLPFRPTVGKEYRRLLVRVENNANSEGKAARCLISNMALAVQPMYRGYISFIGRHMKPFDVVHIKDDFSDMIGPIEVDQVTHTFTAETGWVTTVVPHALVHAIDNISTIQHDTLMDWLGGVSEWYSKNWLWIEIGLFAMAAFTGGGSLAVGALLRGGVHLAARGAVRTLGRKGIRTVFRSQTMRRAFFRAASRTLSRRGARAATGKAGEAAIKTALAKNPNAFFGTLGRFFNVGARVGQALSPWIGAGSVGLHVYYSTVHIKAKWGNVEMPITMHPLILKGRPYTAGLEYGYDETYTMGERIRGFFKHLFDDAREGVERIDKLLSQDSEASKVQQILESEDGG